MLSALLSNSCRVTVVKSSKASLIQTLDYHLCYANVMARTKPKTSLVATSMLDRLAPDVH